MSDIYKCLSNYGSFRQLSMLFQCFHCNSDIMRCSSLLRLAILARQVEGSRAGVALLAAGAGLARGEVRGWDRVRSGLVGAGCDRLGNSKSETAVGVLGDGPSARRIGAGAVSDSGQGTIAACQLGAGDARGLHGAGLEHGERIAGHALETIMNEPAG